VPVRRATLLFLFYCIRHSRRLPGNPKTVSRTATAPFDRLRVFLITRSTDIHPFSTETLMHPERSARAIGRVILKIHAESGVIGFWIGNGLNITKIFPVRVDLVFVWFRRTRSG